MDFINRQLIEKKLRERLGSKRTGWLSNEFPEAFEEEFFIEDLTQKETLKLIENFLEDYGVKTVTFFPDADSYRPNMVGDGKPTIKKKESPL